MKNERIGLIAAILQNGTPVITVKKGTKNHQPADYFKPVASSRSSQNQEPQARPALQVVYDKMKMVAAMFSGGGRRGV